MIEFCGHDGSCFVRTQDVVYVCRICGNLYDYDEMMFWNQLLRGRRSPKYSDVPRLARAEKRVEFLLSELAATIHQYEPSISVEQAREIMESTIEAWENQ